MTIEKLARFIVADYYSGCPGDELFTIAVEREIKRMINSIDIQRDRIQEVTVHVDVRL
jgi:hypothetical protein